MMLPTCKWNWDSPVLGDGITSEEILNVPVGKPKNIFFRTHPKEEYRRRAFIYVHKVEGVIGDETFIVTHEMRELMTLEAQPCTLVTIVDREGRPRIWPIKLPKSTDKDNDAWKTARTIAKQGIDRWVKAVWDGRAYKPRTTAELIAFNVPTACRHPPSPQPDIGGR